MAEHWIPRAHLHEDLLRLYREDNEEVAFLDPVPDERDRVRVLTKSRAAFDTARPLTEEQVAELKERWRTAAAKSRQPLGGSLS